jgi:hypothetical protein
MKIRPANIYITYKGKKTCYTLPKQEDEVNAILRKEEHDDIYGPFPLTVPGDYILAAAAGGPLQIKIYD